MRPTLPVLIALFALGFHPNVVAGKTFRVATFNMAMGLENEGDLARALTSGTDERVSKVAKIIEAVDPDILLLNESDFREEDDPAGWLNEHYLANPFPYSFRAPVNTGVPSGLDITGDGKTDGPGDAWGFGHFPGQYGMLVLSRFPIDAAATRTFQNFRWADLPAALAPRNPDGSPFYPDATWEQLRLSSKSHWDVNIDVEGRTFHFLAHHPTPPVFDGPEDRNGTRNFDEIRFWKLYTQPGITTDFIVDDQGRKGGISQGAAFAVAGDLNADPHDGDSVPGAVGQLLKAPWINNSCLPTSSGAEEASRLSGQANESHRGNPAADTGDWNDKYTGNLRIDYVIPSATLDIVGCGVFWPALGEPGREWIDTSDHRLVWIDVRFNDE